MPRGIDGCETSPLTLKGQNLRDLLTAYDFLARQSGVDAAADRRGWHQLRCLPGGDHDFARSVRWLAMRAPALYKDAGWELPKRRLREDPDLPDAKISCRQYLRLKADRASA
jgi:hypothetical protein